MGSDYLEKGKITNREYNAVLLELLNEIIEKIMSLSKKKIKKK